MDRRSVRSRQMLQDALLSLLREMPFEQIEIQAITERADTARVTFYRHYGKKEELLADTLETLYQQIKATIEPLTVEMLFDFSQPPPIQKLFAFVDGDRPLYKNLITGSMSAVIQQHIRQYMVEQVVLTFSNSPGYADLPVVLIAHNIASQAIGNLMWWLADDLPYSVEYMARMTHMAAFSGVAALMQRREDFDGLISRG